LLDVPITLASPLTGIPRQQHKAKSLDEPINTGQPSL